MAPVHLKSLISHLLQKLLGKLCLANQEERHQMEDAQSADCSVQDCFWKVTSLYPEQWQGQAESATESCPQ